MLNDGTRLNWKTGIAVLAMVTALAGGLWLFNESNHDTQTPAVVVSTGCGGFNTDALKLFDKGDTVALSGAFAPGDHVRLAIDFKGPGYSWELTGVLATTDVEVTGLGSYSSTTKYTFVARDMSDAITSIKSHGKINGSARLEIDMDVRTAGDGTLTIRKTDGMPSLAAPKVTSASCIASKKKSIEPTV